MDEDKIKRSEPGTAPDIRDIVKSAIQEFVRSEQAKSEPAYKTELLEERRRREQLETRVNQLMEENRQNRMRAEELDRSATIRAELQKLGVQKVDLAFKAVKDDITRSDDGRLIARGDQGECGIREYLSDFVTQNPELLPPRISGGSGASSAQTTRSGGFDLDKIKPGMTAEDLERARQEISRIALNTMRS